MCRRAMPNELQPVQRNEVHIDHAGSAHVDHNGKVVPIKNSLIRHETLYANDLLIRRADDIHSKRQLIFHRMKCQRSHHTCAAAGAVSAGMAHPPQRVILCQNSHSLFFFRIDDPFERSRKAGKGILRLNSIFAQQFHNRAGAVIFLGTDLRISGHIIVELTRLRKVIHRLTQQHFPYTPFFFHTASSSTSRFSFQTSIYFIVSLLNLQMVPRPFQE